MLEMADDYWVVFRRSKVTPDKWFWWEEFTEESDAIEWLASVKAHSSNWEFACVRYTKAAP